MGVSHHQLTLYTAGFEAETFQDRVIATLVQLLQIFQNFCALVNKQSEIPASGHILLKLRDMGPEVVDLVREQRGCISKVSLDGKLGK